MNHQPINADSMIRSTNNSMIRSISSSMIRSAKACSSKKRATARDAFKPRPAIRGQLKASRMLSFLAVGGLLVLAACSAAPLLAKPPLVKGLTAEYFSQPDFSGLSKVRIDSRIHFNWREVSPLKGIVPGAFSVRWQGYLLSQQDQLVMPILKAEGSARLWIEGKEIAAGESLELAANKSYALKLEYVKTMKNASISLEWLKSQDLREIIPQAFFEPLAASLVLSPAQELVMGENLLINSDFEGNEGGWLLLGGQVQTKPSSLIASHTALSLQNWAWVQQDLPVNDIKVGTDYTLAGFARADDGASCSLVLLGGSAEGKLFEEKLGFAAKPWSDKEVTVRIPEGTIWVSVALASNAQECQFDEISLVAGDANPAPPPGFPVIPQSPLSNGDFRDDLHRWGTYGGTTSLGSPRPGGSGKTLELGSFTWVQQDLISARYIPEASYKLSAYGRSGAQSVCGLGYIISGATMVFVDELLEFDAADWEEKVLTVTVPESFSWSAIYLRSAEGTCQFADIRLEKQ